jgi:hypothetical protein
LPVKPKVHFDQAAIEFQKEVFADALNVFDLPALNQLGEFHNGLRPDQHRVEHMDAADSPPTDDGPQSSGDDFYFGKFWHPDT